MAKEKEEIFIEGLECKHNTAGNTNLFKVNDINNNDKITATQSKLSKVNLKAEVEDMKSLLITGMLASNLDARNLPIIKSGKDAYGRLFFQAIFENLGSAAKAYSTLLKIIEQTKTNDLYLVRLTTENFTYLLRITYKKIIF